MTEKSHNTWEGTGTCFLPVMHEEKALLQYLLVNLDILFIYRYWLDKLNTLEITTKENMEYFQKTLFNNDKTNFKLKCTYDHLW